MTLFFDNLRITVDNKEYQLDTNIQGLKTVDPNKKVIILLYSGLYFQEVEIGYVVLRAASIGVKSYIHEKSYPVFKVQDIAGWCYVE